MTVLRDRELVDLIERLETASDWLIESDEPAPDEFRKLVYVTCDTLRAVTAYLLELRESRLRDGGDGR